MAAGDDGRRVRQRRGDGDDTTTAVTLPPLLQVLGGNSVTTATVLACFHSDEASALRQVHPAMAAVVAEVPWADVEVSVFDVVRWRAALPAAVAAKVCRLPVDVELPSMSVALAGVHRLHCSKSCISEAALARLPTSLYSLVVGSIGCRYIESTGATFARLSSLASLTCYSSLIGRGDHLPSSLRELCINDYRTLSLAVDFRHLHALQRLTITCEVSNSNIVARLPPSVEELNLLCEFPWSRTLSFAHLSRLRVLNTDGSNIHARALATLPPCVVELTLPSCTAPLDMASFAHLPVLKSLDLSECEISDELLLRLPPSLVTLRASWCKTLTSGAVLPALPALAELDVSDTEVGDALIASLPANLVTLAMTNCMEVTRGATFGHLPALRELHSAGTNLSLAELAACRARGCLAAAAGMLGGHHGDVRSLALLPDGRLVSGDSGGGVRLWDLARVGEPSVTLATTHEWEVHALAVLPGGRHLAIGEHALLRHAGSVEIWDVSCTPCARCAVVGFDAGVQALAVLRNRRIAVACNDCNIWVLRVDGDSGVGEKVHVSGHTASVNALAVLHDGSLASASADGSVRVWDGRSLKCYTVLGGHLHRVVALAVLTDGCLASLSTDGTVRLWDVSVPSTATCVRILPGFCKDTTALAALPDGRLASVPVSDDINIHVWDTRPHQRAACVAIPTVLLARSGTRRPNVLLPLPGGLLASCGAETDTAIDLSHLPPLPPA